MKLDFLDQAASAAQPASSLPTPRIARWQPLRLGLVELYRYDSEEFWFRDGHLLLRGNNGTGKSKVLSLTLPLLFDANLRSARVEPDGDPGKKMAWNLLLGGAYDRRIGYSWIEFGRVAEDGSPRYLTIGVGLLALAARPQVEPWFFIIDEESGARIGQDLWLMNPQRSVLTRERLRETLAGRGLVFENAAAYRRAIDERLFHLGSRRYDALMDTLIQLRQPQLSRRPDESSLSEALTEALAPLPQDLLADVAEAMNQLEEDRRQLEEFGKLHTAVVQFDSRYRAYAGVLSRRQARELRQAQTEFDNASRERNEAESGLEKARATESTATQDHGLVEIALMGHRMRLDTLLSDPATQAANRLEQAVRDVEARNRDVEAAHQEIRVAEDEVEREARLLRNRQQQADESNDRLTGRRTDAALLARLAGIETAYEAEPVASVAADDLIKLPEQQLAAGVRHLHDTAARRRKDVGFIRQRLRERSEAQKTCEMQLSALQEKQEQAEAAAALRVDADAAVESEALDHVEAWNCHFAELKQLQVDADLVLPALTEWVLRLDGEHPGRQALLRAQHVAITRLSARQVALEAQKASLGAEREGLESERHRLLEGADAEPAPPPTRAPGTRSGIAGAPFWKLVDFHEGVADGERAGIEAALEASGLLDAWVTPAGQLVGVEGARSWLDAQWVHRASRPAPNLTRWLRADVSAGAGVPPETVEALLSSVSCGTQEAVDSEAWIAPDGRWRLGNLRGAWAKGEAVYIGHAARLTARRRRLAAIAERLAQLDEQQKLLERDFRMLEEDRVRAGHEWQTAPSEEALRRAHEAASARAREFREIQGQLVQAESRWREADEAARRALAALERDAADLHLPIDGVGLDAVEEDVHRFTDAVHGLAQAVAQWRGALAELAAQSDRQVAARTRLESCVEQVELRREQLEEARARWEVLNEAVGAKADAIRERVREARQSVRDGENALRGAETEVRKAGEARARAETRFEATDAALNQRMTAREDAVRRLQSFAASGLLSSALPELEIPSQQAHWTIDPALALARRAEQMLSAVKDDEESFKRVQRQIGEDFQDLQRALGALGQQAVGEPSEFGLVIHIVYQNRPERPDRLAGRLTDEIAQRRELLTARGREVLENHLQAEIAAEIQRLIRAAEKQVDDINRELHKRPTSTGVRFRLQWQPLQEGEGAPVGLQAARERLLRTSSDLWSQEDRRVVGTMLQQRILDGRQRADALGEAEGGLVDQLARALDYRRWHQFRVQRLQDGQWRRLSGPASSGERALGLTVPLFAAIASFYGHSAQRLAPRLMLLDEAFAGIDDAARAHCMGLVREFDLDFVITSEREWACYAELPGVAICQLQRREGIDAVYVSRWTWDGRSRRRDEDPNRRFPPRMKACVDPRLTRLLGSEALEGLRQRLRRRYEQGLLEGESATLRLTGLNDTEYGALAALLGLPARHRASVQIDVASVDATLRAAGVAGSLREALEILDGPLLDRAAERERIASMWRQVVLACEPPLRQWLDQPHGLGLLKRLARHDVAVAEALSARAVAILKRLPAAGMPRAQLAAEALGDAHALDDGQAVAALVISVLRWLRKEAASPPQDGMAAERRRETWAEAGVLVNELARPVLCLNLPAAGPLGEPAYLSLRRLLRSPVAWEVQDEDVYVCENPNIVAIASDQLGARCRPLICTEGMPAAAQRTLLGQIAARGGRIRYHGDFDWPGLAIGNHVLRVFGALPWRFRSEDYEAALSKAPQPAFQLRGEMVEASWDSALTALMQEFGTSIPEEAVAETLLQDLAA